ncbi:MAG: MerR family transcriptional regulator [Dermabacter sp.]|nr:MerR family transcriptional regulator [Dermabacter sp.]
MRISELSERSGVPVPTVKYYLREGLLAPGEALNARESAYSDDHLARLRLIRGMVHVLGASVAQVRDVVAIIDTRDQSPLEAMGKATSALPTIGAAGGEAPTDEPSRATQLLENLGYHYEADAPGVRQLETALDLAESVGIALDNEQIAVYGDAARRIARADFARIPWEEPDAAIAFAVLGTALYEPVLLALRRLAHYELGLALEAAPDTQPDAE